MAQKAIQGFMDNPVGTEQSWHSRGVLLNLSAFRPVDFIKHAAWQGDAGPVCTRPGIKFFMVLFNPYLFHEVASVLT